MRRRRRRKGIAWFRQRPAWGTVYLMQSLDEPDLFKVGFTKRLTKSRRNELKGKVGGRLKVYYTLSMPNAYFTEQRVLRDLRARWFGRGDRRGTEWFRLWRNETLPDVAARIFKAAGVVRRVSKLKLSWPKGQEFVIYGCNELAVLDDKGSFAGGGEMTRCLRPAVHEIRSGRGTRAHVAECCIMFECPLSGSPGQN